MAMNIGFTGYAAQVLCTLMALLAEFRVAEASQGWRVPRASTFSQRAELLWVRHRGTWKQLWGQFGHAADTIYCVGITRLSLRRGCKGAAAQDVVAPQQPESQAGSWI